jgi:N-acetylmuramoyl-L-alanine amidase
MKICIDAGHGGNDSGADGPTGLSEAKVVLELSDLVEQGLKKLGIHTRMTRRTDDYVELHDRCEIANDWEADYFVSIHCNSNGPTAVGIETLYASNSGKKLADPIQFEMLAATGDVDRGLKHRTNLYVLNGTSMPAVLAEVGFISHPATEAKLKTDDYKHAIANSIVNGLAKYLRSITETPIK